MKEKAFTVTFLLTLALTGPFTARASEAQSCKPPVSVGDVRYLGKVESNDKVKVSWSVGTGCMGGQGAAFTVKMKVTRRLGHVDEGTATQALSGASAETTVTVPRGSLETDPQTYTVTITGAAASNASASAAAEATLTEASSAAGKSFPEPAAATNPCGMSAGIVKIAYKGRTAGKDRVEVGWQAKSACTKPVDARLTMIVVSQPGDSRATVTFTHPANPATANFNVAASTIVEVPVTTDNPIVRFAASVSETGRSTDTVSATKSGSF